MSYRKQFGQNHNILSCKRKKGILIAKLRYQVLNLLVVSLLIAINWITAAAQDLQPEAEQPSLGVRINIQSVNLAPPLPEPLPKLGPPVRTARSLPSPTVVTTANATSGRTGYGYGSSKIGSGLEILSNPDDMEQRSTAIDLSLIQSSEHFVMPAVADGERWIRVDLGNQQVVAYEGTNPLRAFIVSTGIPRFQTVTGTFRIQMKVSEQTMSGVGYSLPGVKWVQYFYSEFALHGTYWHSDFGVPKSHGCVNMTNADAKWLFDWAGPVWDQETVWFRSSPENPGTLVVVHK